MHVCVVVCSPACLPACVLRMGLRGRERAMGEPKMGVSETSVLPVAQPKETTDIRDFLKKSRQKDAKCTAAAAARALRCLCASVRGVSIRCLFVRAVFSLFDVGGGGNCAYDSFSVCPPSPLSFAVSPSPSGISSLHPPACSLLCSVVCALVVSSLAQL